MSAPDVMVLSDSDDEDDDLHSVPLAARLNNSRNNSLMADVDQSPGSRFPGSQTSTFSTGSDAVEAKQETLPLYGIAADSSR